MRAIILALLGVAILALVALSRRAYRRIERDFPQSWNAKR